MQQNIRHPLSEFGPGYLSTKAFFKGEKASYFFCIRLDQNSQKKHLKYNGDTGFIREIKHNSSLASWSVYGKEN